MTDEFSDIDPIDELVDEFLTRKSAGENPTISEFCRQYPDLEVEIRDVFPTLIILEESKPKPSSAPEPIIEMVGDYRIVTEIGRGGMGVVYQASQESLGRTVALKVLSSRWATDSNAMERFRREAQAAARLHHTNIVPVYEVGEEQGHCYYAMQMIEGRSLDKLVVRLSESTNQISSQRMQLLKEVIANDKPIDGGVGTEQRGQGIGHRRDDYYKTVAEIGVQAADALEFAHARGIIHRDIKPSNLLLDKQGVVWITDFGLAKTDSDAMTREGDVLGTLCYMSPERLQGQCDARSDVYALGLTLYELLTLRPAFSTSDRLRLVSLISASEPTPPRELDTNVPRDLETVVLKAMEKNPEARYQSAGELSSDLHRFLEGVPVKALRISALRRLARWGRRNRALAASMAAVTLSLVLLTIGSVSFTLSYRRQQAAIRQNAELATVQATLAEERLKEVLRLADIKRLEEYISQADQLWPAIPENIEAMEEWISRATVLAGRLDSHRQSLSDIRRSGTLVEEGDASQPEKVRQVWRFPDEGLQWQHDTLSGLVASLEEFRSEDPLKGTLANVKQRLQFARTVKQKTLEDHPEIWERACMSIADVLECPQYQGLSIQPQLGLIPVGRDLVSGMWEFAHLQTGEPPIREDGELVVTEETGLVFVLLPGGSLRMGAVRPVLGAELTVEEDSLVVGQIESDSLAEVLGLRTGDQLKSIAGKPMHTYENARNALGILATGDKLVMKILRSGQQMYLQCDVPANIDPWAAPNEGPIRTVTLEPFFLSKYEMTQGQWQRVFGENSAFWASQIAYDEQPVSLRHPIEHVSGVMCRDVIEHRLDLLLPTEAQWEYGARAGTSFVWWVGNRPQLLVGAANLADVHASTTLKSGAYGWPLELWLNDGYALHAPVGIYKANPFGLHGMIGNVAEMCRDVYVEHHESPTLEGTGEKAIRQPNPFRVVRGAHFRSAAIEGRTAARTGMIDYEKSARIGVRPARAIDR